MWAPEKPRRSSRSRIPIERSSKPPAGNDPFASAALPSHNVAMDLLKETNFDFLGAKKIGKVRDIYEQANKLILITTDRHSSFDRIIAHIPWKGQVLNQVSAWWFERTKDIVPNHVLAIPDPNVTVAKKCRLVPIE